MLHQAPCLHLVPREPIALLVLDIVSPVGWDSYVRTHLQRLSPAQVSQRLNSPMNFSHLVLSTIVGTYSNVTNGTQCIQCPPSYICANPSSSPVKCNAGYYTSNSTQCLICPAGFSCNATTSLPTACDIGTYSLSGATYCHQCPAGYSCPST